MKQSKWQALHLKALGDHPGLQGAQQPHPHIGGDWPGESPEDFLAGVVDVQVACH